MAAPKGNQFWELRSKHGRDKLFTSPELLWEAACEYFTWCNKNPWIKKDWVGKDAMPVDRKTERPYTITGLCLYFEASESFWRKFKETQADNEDFFTVITRIEQTIYTQKFEGAVVGAFNANIIARDLGLADKKELTHSGELAAPDLSGMTFEQIYALKYGKLPDAA